MLARWCKAGAGCSCASVLHGCDQEHERERGDEGEGEGAGGKQLGGRHAGWPADETSQPAGRERREREREWPPAWAPEGCLSFRGAAALRPRSLPVTS